MREVKIMDLRQNIFKELESLPISVMKRERVLGVVITEEEYKRLKGLEDVRGKVEEKRGVAAAVRGNEGILTIEDHERVYGDARERLGLPRRIGAGDFYPGGSWNQWEMGRGRVPVEAGKWRKLGY